MEGNYYLKRIKRTLCSQWGISSVLAVPFSPVSSRDNHPLSNQLGFLNIFLNTAKMPFHNENKQFNIHVLRIMVWQNKVDMWM